ncbi:MAG: dUTPase [Candidatus Nitrosocosmicus sp.]|nr:dUTPase [Candidatus Nitrosocosmicus sp.]
MDYKDIWNKQKQYNTDHLHKNNEEFWKGKEEFAGKRIFMITSALVHEGIELQRETNWKWWKTPKDLDMNKIKDEIVDIFHFANQLAFEAGMSYEEFLQVFDTKLNENIDRQRRGY